MNATNLSNGGVTAAGSVGTDGGPSKVMMDSSSGTQSRPASQARAVAEPKISLPPQPGKEDSIDTHQKALQINLDPTKYGTFAEIGAGQEVARWFFRVGGAAGTIAKSMSAYDMTVSDAIYGPCERYVTRHRLQNMLDHEYGLLQERL